MAKKTKPFTTGLPTLEIEYRDFLNSPNDDVIFTKIKVEVTSLNLNTQSMRVRGYYIDAPPLWQLDTDYIPLDKITWKIVTTDVPMDTFNEKYKITEI